jgi:glutathione S-transferase
MSDTDPNHYTVYYNPFSICSIFVRSTLAFSKTPASGTPITVTESLVDIYKDEQLHEDFLLTINPKGQVPAMTSPSLAEPLTDSLPITYHICELYPHLAPGENKEFIYRLLKELHAIQYLSLSFTPAQNRAGGITIAIEKLLERGDISEKYREALKWKAA